MSHTDSKLLAHPARDLAATAGGLVELCKPRVTRLVVVTTWLGAVIAPGHPSLPRLLTTLLGTVMVVAGANALNMYLERDVDAKMERTRRRPIPSGRVGAELGLGFALGLGLFGQAILTRWVNPSTGLLAAVAFVTYAFVYTPLKRHTPYSLHVGAVPGALPPLIGWVSMSEQLSPAALSLFFLLFVWQIPHFLAIALFLSDDYRRAGLQVYPNVYGVSSTYRAIAVWSVILLLAALLPAWLGLGGLVYTWIAGSSGLAFLGLATLGRRWIAPEKWARAVFFASMPYLVLLFGALAFSG